MELDISTIIGIVAGLYGFYCIYRVYKAEKFVNSIPTEVELSENDRQRSAMSIVLPMIFGFKPFKLESWFDRESIRNIREEQHKNQILDWYENEFNE